MKKTSESEATTTHVTLLDKILLRSDFERLMSLSDAELVQLGERIREAYAEQNLGPVPQYLYPNVVNMGVEGNGGVQIV